MDNINQLLELEKTIRIAYLKLVECELSDNTKEYNLVKELLIRLISRENMMMKEILKNNQSLLELDDLLISNFSDDYGFYDEVFMKKTDFEYNPLILSRIYARFNNNLIYLSDEQILELTDTEWLIKLGISTKKLEELSIFNWNIMNMAYSTSFKLELLFINKYINTLNQKDKDYESLIYYKHMLVYANPSLEKYLLNNEKLTSKVPDILNRHNEYSNDYKKVYHAIITNSIIPDINSVVNMLLNDNDYKNYECSTKVIEFLYLTSIKSNLYLLDEKEFLITRNNILKGITNNLKYLSAIGKQQEILKLTELLDKCEKEKKLKK